MFIKIGLYDDTNDWTEENMEHFHKDRLIRKIDTHLLSLGYTTQTPHINGLLKDFISDIHMLQKFRKNIILQKYTTKISKIILNIYFHIFHQLIKNIY